MDSGSRYSLLADVLRANGLSDPDIEEVALHLEELRADNDTAASDGTPYRLRDHILSPSEHRFFLILRQATDGWAEVYPKVGLGSLFYSRIGSHTQYLIDSHLLHRTQVEFLLYRPETLRPLLGIMLDAGPSHRKPGQHGQFFDPVFAAARVPLLHIAAERAYDVYALSQLMAREAGLIGKGPAAQPAQLPPDCPQCGQTMALSTEQSGALVWACASFPCCRTAKLYEPAPSAARA